MEHQFSVGDRVRFEFEGFPTVGKIVDFHPDGDAVIRSGVGVVHVDVEMLEPAEY